MQAIILTLVNSGLTRTGKRCGVLSNSRVEHTRPCWIERQRVQRGVRAQREGKSFPAFSGIQRAIDLSILRGDIEMLRVLRVNHHSLGMAPIGADRFPTDAEARMVRENNESGQNQKELMSKFETPHVYSRLRTIADTGNP